LNDLTWDERFLDEGVNLFTLAKRVFTTNQYRGVQSTILPQKDEELLAPVGFTTGAKPRAPKRGDYSSDIAFKGAMEYWQKQLKYSAAYSFFTECHCSVELWWGNDTPRLDKVYFSLPSHCRMLKYLEAKKMRLLNSLDFRTNDRLRQFVHAAGDFDEEMQHIEVLSNFLLYNLLRPYIPLFKSLSFLLALFMNLILV